MPPALLSPHSACGDCLALEAQGGEGLHTHRSFKPFGRLSEVLANPAQLATAWPCPAYCVPSQSLPNPCLQGEATSMPTQGTLKQM